MKNYFRQLALFAVVFCLAQCDDKSFPEAAYPRIKTLPVTNVNSSGATFHASTIQPGTEEVVNRGFVWGTESTVTDNGERIDLGPGGGEFEAVATYGLVDGKTYYVKAFVKTTGFTVYGPSVQFKSGGSPGPEMISFAPMTGTWGDTVTIKGSHFSGVPLNNLVTFGGDRAYVIRSTESTIVCLVPDIKEAVPLTITVGTSQIKSADNFTLLAPIINSFSPQAATFGEFVTIKGIRFHPYTSQNGVMFGTEPAEVLAASTTELVVKVPSSIRKKESTITVASKGLNATSATTFAISAPLVTHLSVTKAKTGESLFITGNNFNIERGGTIVMFDGQEASIESATKTSLQVTVPNGAYAHRSFQIEVQVAEQSAFSSETFELQDAWLRTTDIPAYPGLYGATAFAVSGAAYVGLGANSDNSFWKFRPTEKDWTEVAAFPGGSRWKPATFVVGSYAYVGLGKGDTNQFWRFSPAANAWTPIANFPILNTSTQTVGFSAHGKGYVVTSDETDNFWEYNPSTNSWAKKADYPGVYLPQNYPTTGFVINNNIYVYSEDNSSSANLVYRYDPVTNAWSTVASPNYAGAATGETGFALNGKGYIRSDLYMFIYDPGIDSWEIEMEVNVPGHRDNSIAIDLDGKAYFGGRYYLTDWWEYDPEFD